MNNANATCATSDYEVKWHNIDWAKCHQAVKRLQARIVKATQVGRWNKVKALQWLLTHSFSGKALAVKRVTENKGKNTSGIDGTTWSTPIAKIKAILSLGRRGYKVSPLRRVIIPKKNGKTRPLGIPTIKDRAMQALHLLALAPVAETTADNNSYGFRPERSTTDAREQCFAILAKKWSSQWVLEGDIKSCFDNISHEWLQNHVVMDKVILQKWLKAGFIYEKELFPTEAGTPQGGIISPTLANITLDGLEAELLKEFATSKKGKISRKLRERNKVHLVRYADDFIVTGTTKELLEDEVKPIIENFLKDRGLTLSVEKTKITHIDDGFNFLGWNIRKYNGKLLTKPAKRNVAAILSKIRATVKKNRQATQENLIRLLNPIIQGWANYHRGAVAKKTFNKIDQSIWTMLWKWAKRRHPRKGSIWVKDRYWVRKGTREWVFATDKLKLGLASDTPIVRQVKIRGEANPFDPEQDAYFDRRTGQKMKETLSGNKGLLILLNRQNGKCPICHQKITIDSEWNVHHVIPKSEGGKDNVANLEMLHPNCHRQVHCQKS